MCHLGVSGCLLGVSRKEPIATKDNTAADCQHNTEVNLPDFCIVLADIKLLANVKHVERVGVRIFDFVTQAETYRQCSQKGSDHQLFVHACSWASFPSQANTNQVADSGTLPLDSNYNTRAGNEYAGTYAFESRRCKGAEYRGA